METVLTPSLSMAPDTTSDRISEENFDEIVRRHQRRVYRVIYVLLRDADAADTLTQECFLRAFRARASFRGECGLGTWILRIAVNLARDHGKSRRVRFWKKLVGLEAEHTGAPDRWSSPQPTPEKLLLLREEVNAVWNAAATLSTQQRTIFLLRFVEEMSLAEVADILGLRVGSVKAQQFRALGKIRKTMKEQQWR